MAHSQKELGVITALMERFEKERLPRALALREKVGAGEKLDDADLAFLQKVLSDVNANKHLAEDFPEYKKLIARMVGLYHEITELAVTNEGAD